MNNTELALEDLKHWDESCFTELKEVMRDLEGSRVTDVTYNGITRLFTVHKLGGYSYSLFFNRDKLSPNYSYRTTIYRENASWYLPTLLIMEQLNEDILRYAKEHLGFDNELKYWHQCIELVLKEASK